MESATKVENEYRHDKSSRNMNNLDDDLLRKVIDNEYEFIRRYQKKYLQQPEIDIFIVAFLKELQERRAMAKEGDEF